MCDHIDKLPDGLVHTISPLQVGKTKCAVTFAGNLRKVAKGANKVSKMQDNVKSAVVKGQ